MIVFNTLKIVNIFILSAFISLFAQAEKLKPWHASLVLGFGSHESALINEDSLSTYANINFSYFSEYWFFDSGDFGLTLINNDTMTFNLITNINTTSLYFSDPIFSTIEFGSFGFGGFGGEASIDVNTDNQTPTENPTEPTNTPTPEPTPDPEIPIYDYVAERNIAFEAGAEILFDAFGGTLQANIVHDISAQHNGFHGGLSFNRGFTVKQFTIIPSISIGFQSPEYNDYYWGVKDHEKIGWLIPYQGQWGINTSADITVSQRYSKHWSVVAVFRQRWLGTIISSPLVDDEHLSAGFAGVRYEF